LTQLRHRARPASEFGWGHFSLAT